jgi:hypothetical protein
MCSAAARLPRLFDSGAGEHPATNPVPDNSPRRILGNGRKKYCSKEARS